MSTHQHGIIDQTLAAQWRDLSRWFRSADVVSAYDRPSVLDGWSVHDLIAHVGRSVHALTTLRAASGTAPQSALAYLTRYADAASDIADGTRELSETMRGDLASEVDRLAAAGLDALASIRSDIVLAPRGPIHRDDFVLTRLLELVVHADDLARSLPTPTAPPITPGADTIVAMMLASAYADKTGRWPESRPELAWIRRACGRAPSDDPALPLL